MGQMGNWRTSQFGHNPRPLDTPIGIRLLVYSPNSEAQDHSLNCAYCRKQCSQSKISFLYLHIIWMFCSVLVLWSGILLFDYHRDIGFGLALVGLCGYLSGASSLFFCDPLFWRVGGQIMTSSNPCQREQTNNSEPFQHDGENVSQKHLTILVLL